MIENINTFNRWSQVFPPEADPPSAETIGIRDCCIRQQSHIVLVFLLFVFITFNSVSNSYSLDIPCPPNTELTEEGPRQYRSLLTQDKILKFYRQKLIREGWRQGDAPLQQASGFNSLSRTFDFVKGSDTLVLTFSPFTAEGFVFYTVDVGSPPGVSDLAESENPSLDDAFKEPEPLDFMPIFPGSKQVDYRRISSGIYFGYMVNKEVEEIKEFYLGGMPEYGWNLTDQESLDEKETGTSVKISGVTLKFKQEDKTCSVTVSKIGNLSSSGARDLTSLGLGDTIITVLYNDKK